MLCYLQSKHQCNKRVVGYWYLFFNSKTGRHYIWKPKEKLKNETTITASWIFSDTDASITLPFETGAVYQNKIKNEMNKFSHFFQVEWHIMQLGILMW